MKHISAANSTKRQQMAAIQQSGSRDPIRHGGSSNNFEAGFPWRERGNMAAKIAAAKKFAAAAKPFSNPTLSPLPPLPTY